MNKKYIGILGGSFDPPHDGHIFISKYAMLRLNLKEVWWIVTYNNPLKKGSNSYEKRLNLTKKFLCHRKIRLLEIKQSENSYTINTIVYLKKKYKKNKFIWLMGTDNLKNLHHWKDWKKIFYNIPIAIFDRPSYHLNVTKSKALSFFRKARIKNSFFIKSRNLLPPKWIFVSGMKNNQSSSYLRKIHEN